MGGQVSIPEGVHVVVVGGGFGGIAAAQQLKSEGVPFTLIDMREAFHHNVAGLRASVQPGFAQRTFIPFAKTFGSSFVQGRVENVDPDRQTVILQGGREIQYSHLILCTGTDGPFPGKFNAESSLEASVQKYEELVEQIQAADSVLVIGGGSTGVEMAAEIKTEYPEKKVVLIHSRIGLADPELTSSVRQQAKDVLLEKGVELLLGQKVSRMSELQLNKTQKNMKVSTERGETLTTDLIICCTGLKINSAAYSLGLKLPEHSQRVSYMKDLVRALPLPNYNTMELLCKHLCKVIEHKDSNRMSVQSIAIVFGPTLLWSQTESANMAVFMVFQSQIVELLLREFNTIFSEV